MIRLTPTQIGDTLDLERDATYPCSDGSVTTIVSIDELLKAQLKKVVDTLKSKAVKAWGGNVIILEEDWEALLKEVEE